MNSTESSKSRRGRKAAEKPVVPVTADAALTETAVRLIAYDRLERAPENVRHTREAEDVAELADDIAGHGLLQSLIGYEEDASAAASRGEPPRVFIVGGGRRLGALALLHTRGLVADDYRVPVLVRDQEEAVELSLAENLARRTTSPVDEFFAFRHMRAQGATEADLAKRFGFSERYVKQRLRLAELHSEVLNALRDRAITLDAAMAYASSSDPEAQVREFRAQSRPNAWKPHDPDRIRQDLRTKAHTSGDPVALFVGEEAYVAAGGRYEDDLFATSLGTADARAIADGGLLERLAKEKLQAELIDFVSAKNRAGAGINAGALIAPDLNVDRWQWTKPKAPAGFTLVDAQYEEKARWNAARNCGAQVKGIVGLDGEGRMVLVGTHFFVSDDKLKEVVPSRAAPEPYRPLTAEQLEERRRTGAVETWSRRLALPAFAGTALEGRVFWPPEYQEASDRMVHPTLGEGYVVNTRLFVTREEVDARVADASAKVDELAAAKRAAAEAAAEGQREADAAEGERRTAWEARAQEIAAAEPAVLIADGTTWFLRDDGGYADQPEGGEEPDVYFDELIELLDSAEDLGAFFPTVEDYRVAAEADPALVGAVA